MVRARIDEYVKEEATAVRAAARLTVSDAFHILLTRVAREKVPVFEPLVSNDGTIAATKVPHKDALETVTLDELDEAFDADN